MKLKWNDITTWFSFYVFQARSIRTPKACAVFFYMIVIDMVRFMKSYSTYDDNVSNDAIASKLSKSKQVSSCDDIFLKITTSTTACTIYFMTFIAAYTHHFWILHGISLLIFCHVGSIILKWLVYIFDDPELIMNITYLKASMRILLNEGEDILSGDAAWKLGMMYTVITQVPTGMSYLQYVIRYKTRRLRKEFLKELGVNRFGGRIFLLSSKFNTGIRSSRPNNDSVKLNATIPSLNIENFWESDDDS